MIKKSIFNCILWISILPCSFAQTPIDQTLETFSTALGKVGLGTFESDFFNVKTTLRKPEPSANAFRDEVVEIIDKNDLTSITYYFDLDENRPLYELIVEFSDEIVCYEMAEKLLGASNYPDKPDHWIAGAEENVVTVAWTFGKKLVIAANLPGSEWSGDPLFKVPPGFDLYKHLPGMSSWPAVELDRFFTALEKQIAAGNEDFASIRVDEETDGYYPCNEPLAGAETSNVFKNDNGKWLVGNTMISGASAENAILWKLEVENLLSKTDTEKIKLTRTKSKPGFGTSIDLWDVTDKTGKSNNMQIGVMHYEWGAEGLWSVDILVLKK